MLLPWSTPPRECKSSFATWVMQCMCGPHAMRPHAVVRCGLPGSLGGRKACVVASVSKIRRGCDRRRSFARRSRSRRGHAFPGPSDSPSAPGWDPFPKHSQRICKGPCPTPISRPACCGERLAHWVAAPFALRGLEDPGNEGSRNLLLDCDGNRVLLCGDAEDEGLRGLLPEIAKHAPLAALLVPHHGSEQPHWEELTRAGRPMELWFSARESSPLALRSALGPLPVRWTARDGPWMIDFAPSPAPNGFPQASPRHPGNLETKDR